MSSPRRRPRSSAAPPLDDDDLLPEILLRLPPLPSALPRASAVCKFWRSLASDPGFSRRFRAHHRRNPPLLGCFVKDLGQVRFQPALESPNRVPQARFSFPIAAGNRFRIRGCRHGLVLVSLSLQKASQRKLLVWDPITADQHLLDIPRGFDTASISAAVLRVPGDILHFQVVLVGNSDIQSTQAVASVYSSVTGVWDNLVSTPLPPEDFGSPTMVYTGMPAVMVGASFYWLLYGYGDSLEILEFDLDKRSLALIPMPVGDTGDTRDRNIWVMLAEGGGLGFIFLRGFHAQLWKMKTDCKGVASWVLGRTVELDKLLSLNSENQRERPRILGFAEDNNVVLLWTSVGVFTVQFESLQIKKVFESSAWHRYFPFEGVYTADASIGGGNDEAKLLQNI